MKTGFWPLLIILLLVIGCASTSYEGRPAHLENGSDYWNYLLYHQTAAEPQGQLWLPERAISAAPPFPPLLALLPQGR